MNEKREDTQRDALLRRLWIGWTRFAGKVADIQVRLILALFYFTVFALFALPLRFAADPLSIKARTRKGWHKRPAEEAREAMDRARLQS